MNAKDDIGKEPFTYCAGDHRFFRHQCVVRRKPTASERASDNLSWNDTPYRDLGSINDFEELAPGIWVAHVMWEGPRCSRIRLRDLEPNEEWFQRTGHPEYPNDRTLLSDAA